MIRIENSDDRERTPNPEELFRELHRNSANILDRMCQVGPNKTYESFEKEIQQLNLILISTYGTATKIFEGEFDKEVPGVGILHVKFYSTGYMELVLRGSST
jgi:hypothetical protein